MGVGRDSPNARSGHGALIRTIELSLPCTQNSSRGRTVDYQAQSYGIRGPLGSAARDPAKSFMRSAGTREKPSRNGVGLTGLRSQILTTPAQAVWPARRARS
jgi:hypothetical protein